MKLDLIYCGLDGTSAEQFLQLFDHEIRNPYIASEF